MQSRGLLGSVRTYSFCLRTVHEHIYNTAITLYYIYYFACSHSPDVRTAAAAQGYLAISGLTWRCGQLGGDVMLLMRASATSTGKRSIEDVRRGQDTVPRRTSRRGWEVNMADLRN